jgi:hypothetical protein
LLHRQEKKAIIDREYTINKIWSLGGDTGWYYGDWLWELGIYRQNVWGCRLQKRTNRHEIHSGDVLDFGVFYMHKEEGKLVLYAEMKLPGQAWLEFKIINNTLYQAATFKPRGIWGKLYWYLYYLFMDSFLMAQ